MAIEQQTGVGFNGVDFVKVDFESHGRYEGKSTIDVAIKPSVFYPKGQEEDSDFVILMDITLKCKDKFKLTILALGNFRVGEDLVGEKRKSIINVNAPAIMFPYVRSFIANFTSSVGEPTKGGITIPPQFFKGDLEIHSPDKEDSDLIE